jgi:heat shock protein HslJ
MNMNKKSIIVALVVVVIAIGVGLYFFTNKKAATNNITATNPKNATYIIEGQPVTLINGTSVVPIAPGSASKVTTQYFGNEFMYDLNEDGKQDVVFILTQNTGGSGTFFYAVAALNTNNGYIGSDGYLMGDRIAPQTIGLSPNPNHKNVIVVNYADRVAGEPMTTRPSMGKSAYLKLDPDHMQWGIVEPDFEGEVDSSKMKLNMKTWDWIRTTYNNDTKVTPNTTGRFTLTFKDSKTFSATTDCNGVGGEYILGNNNRITFTKMMSTLMYCENSQEQDFTKMLDQVQSYQFTSKGELIFDLKLDTGSMIFK